MKNISSLLHVCLLLVLSHSSVWAQADFPEDGAIFRDDIVPRIDISIHPDTLTWIYENVESNNEFRVTYTFTTDTLVETIEDVGFRLRGNTSRYSQKKSFKISFNSFQSGRDFYGLEKVNLNGEHNDPSIIRSKLSWKLARDFGIPGARANHVERYINNNYFGLYVQVEQIDEEFVESRFDNKDGNLYKCLWPSDLDDRGSEPEDYQHLNSGQRVYDLKTNTLADDYSDIAEFITQLNHLPNEDFDCEIGQYYNVLDYLRVIAFDVFIGNWDGPIYNKNNFYLYHNTKSDRFEYIPYDLDNTFGIDWSNIDWANRNIYQWAKQGEPRPIYQKMMDNDRLREIYTQYMAALIGEDFTGSAFNIEVNRIKDMITPYVENDPYYPLDYGYSITDFNNSYIMELGDHVPIGFFQYIIQRKQSALDQLEGYNNQAIINHIRYKVKNDGKDLRIRAYANEPADLKLVFSVDDGPEQELSMYDDGNHNDIDAHDGVYAYTITEIPINTEIHYQIKSIPEMGEVLIAPCEPLFYHYRESQLPLLKINEFLASNSTSNSDEFGNYGDWIEVYNADNETVYLGDKYLSDNISDPNKWSLPDTYLEPKEFILIWADGDPGKGDHHSNFKLSASGEEIGLFDAEGTGYYPLDTLIYGVQSTDISQGRFGDGENTWRYFPLPTPGYSNMVDGLDEELNIGQLSIYPNPNTHGKLFINKQSDIRIYNLNGVLLLESLQAIEVDVSPLSSGVYLVQNGRGYVQKLIIQ